MRAVINIEMIVTVQLQSIKLKHKTLEYTVRLKGYGAIQFPFVLWRYNGPINFSVEISQKVISAYVLHLIWKIRSEKNGMISGVDK